MGKIDLFLENILGRRVRPDLSPLRSALIEAGFSEGDFTKVLVTGTNGKGSTSFIFHSILKIAGLKSGLLTSPHICSVTERIKIDGSLHEEEWIEALENYLPIIRRYSLTYYEITVLLTFHFFRKYGVDTGIMETGMGGRWDGSNVFGGEYGIITSVGLDHSEFLGNSLRQIFIEKVEILRRSRAGVSGVSRKFFREVDFYPPEGIYFFNEDFNYRKGGRISTFRIRDIAFKIPGLSPLPQWHRSVAMALMGAYLILGREALMKKKNEIENSLPLLKIPGRWDLRIIDEKEVLLDVAHNPQAWSRLIQNVYRYFTEGEEPVWIIGVLRDKNWRYLFNKLEGKEVFYVEVGPEERRLTFEMVSDRYPYVRYCPGVKECIAGIRSRKVVVTGSFYTVAQAVCPELKT